MEERCAERVAIALRIDDDALACPVPVMSIQPLLENIFKHTVELRRGTAHIAISASRRDQLLLVPLEDDTRAATATSCSCTWAATGAFAGAPAA